nr:VOC family protein [Candidatus Cloacimonadota bacterium]
IVFLQGEGEVRLELIEDKTITILDRIGSNVSIGIYVENIETTKAFLLKKKVAPMRGPLTMPNGTKLLFISDPNGVEIEFIQDKARD